MLYRPRNELEKNVIQANKEREERIQEDKQKSDALRFRLNLIFSAVAAIAAVVAAVAAVIGLFR